MSLFGRVYSRYKDDSSQSETSAVATFYSGLSVFVTGGTDLLGKCTVEKLIRACPNIKKVGVLLRTKNKENFEEKCQDYLKDGIFDVLRNSSPDFGNKLVFYHGDLQEDRLGLSDADYKALVDQTNVIIHNGHNSGLNSKQRRVTRALNTNIYGTKRVLELAAACKILECLVYVSNICAQSPEANSGVKEQFYDPPGSLKAIDDMIESDSIHQGLSDKSLKMMLGNIPNLSAYCKGVCEDMINKYAISAKHSCCVFRPSLVISTYEEPVNAYCDAKNEAANFLINMSRGATHGMMDVKYPIDLVPADLAANSLILATRDSVKRATTDSHRAFVYNIGSSIENPVTLREFYRKSTLRPRAFASSKCCSKGFICFVNSMWQLMLVQILLCYVPAAIVDALALVTGRKVTHVSMIREAARQNCRLHCHVYKNWRVEIDEMTRVIEELNSVDKKQFFGDIRKLDWDKYFKNYWVGIKSHVLKESMTEDDSKKRCCHHHKCKDCLMWIAHAFVVLIFGAFASYAIAVFLS